MFAPLEGITDECYRLMMFKLYPEWDSMSCDFLRVPNPSPYPQKHIIKHYGRSIYEHNEYKNKNIYQILTSPGAYTQRTVNDIQELGFEWLDLNLGCPSKTVCKNKGGSFLLSDLTLLKPIIREIRENFKHTFTCKIRVGYQDDHNFEDIIKLLSDEGVDAIKIHARTRAELYKGTANWDYVKRAVELTDTPIIGNGDIWTTGDIKRYFEYTGCHSVMLGRGALKTPWLARDYKSGKTETPLERAIEIKRYYEAFYKETLDFKPDESTRIKRIKSVSRYLFEDLENGDAFRRRVLLAKSFTEQMNSVNDLISSLS
jgi:tRNA-dihydrouridine synthase B